MKTRYFWVRAPRRSAALTGAALLCVVGAGAAGCSWNRFNELGDTAPVERVEVPSDRSDGFGATLAALSTREVAQLLVGGLPGTTGASLYELGPDEDPNLEAADLGHCERTTETRVCALANQMVGMPRSWGPRSPKSRCFVSGAGRTGDGTRDEGLWARCAEQVEFSFPVPEDVQRDYVDPLIEESEVAPLFLAVNRSEEPALIAGVPSLGRAFFYLPMEGQPRDLVPRPAAGEDYGAAVAALGLGPDEHLLAVAAPAAGEVWLYRTSGADPALVGCLGGPELWGRTLASGDVDGDGVDDLVVADRLYVTVLSGAGLALLQAAETATCSLASLPPSTLLASLGCGAGPETSGCEVSEFGSSLAVGDFDGDGRGEVAVGAPRINVRGKAEAGAVLIYNAEGELVDTRYLSTADEGDRFGTSLAVASQGTERDVLAVGAPGASSATVVYCATLAGSGVSPRCL